MVILILVISTIVGAAIGVSSARNIYGFIGGAIFGAVIGGLFLFLTSF